MRFIYCVLFLLSTFAGKLWSQEIYSYENISPFLIVNSNAVVRDYDVNITINDLDEVVVQTKRVVTVLNKEGANFINAYEYYYDGDKLKNQEALILDVSGNEIKKIKGKDFIDISAYGASTLFADSRVSYFEYTPKSYPYTIIYTSEIVKDNSVFLRSWFPAEGYNVSVENSSFEIINNTDHEIRKLEKNIEGLKIKKDETVTGYSYNLKEKLALQKEIFSPSLNEIFPIVSFSLNKFVLEGVPGEAKDWKAFGKWMYDNLISDHDQLPPSTIKEIDELVKGIDSKEEKARKIYQYVQDNTRYVSVQYGIGGWEPESAMTVDEMGYGDCKALTNYTMALLKTQGIDSYYTVIHSGEKKNFNPDFPKMQGNHVILNIPMEGADDMWLECTSQSVPFNYMGDFTDDRLALKITPDGGEIVQTIKYSAEDNLEQIDCEIKLDKTGGFIADFARSSYGINYGERYFLGDFTEKEQKQYYREEWSKFQNVNFENLSFKNDRRNIHFLEKHQFSGERLATIAGKRLLLPLNFIQQESFYLPKIENRKMPLKIYRGQTFRDQFTFILPDGFSIEALPENEKLTSEFGEFSIDITAKESIGTQIIVDRYLLIKEGEWSADKFEDFREFISKMSNLNNLKAVIINNSKS